MSDLSEVVGKARPKAVVATIFTMVNQGHCALLESWRKGIDYVWDDQDTASILAEMGTDAAKIFDISTRTYMFLESGEPGCTLDRLAKIRPYTTHPDGSVTLD